jgi:hypothetical protein
MTLGELLCDHRVCDERPVPCERKRETDREDRCTDKRVEINGSILGFLCWSLASSINNSSHLSNFAVFCWNKYYLLVDHACSSYLGCTLG